jgi:hypothetical protein
VEANHSVHPKTGIHSYHIQKLAAEAPQQSSFHVCLSSIEAAAAAPGGWAVRVAKMRDARRGATEEGTIDANDGV